jgi:AraC-like DNA-binding protein
MQLPHFSLSNYGVSNIRRPRQYPSPIRFYELEFYTEDYPGGTITDGVFRSARKGYYALYRPGQLQQLVAPYRCYYLNISTQDPLLFDFFDNLPDTGPVWNLEEIVEQIRRMQRTEAPESLAGRLRLEACAAQVLQLLAQQPVTEGRLRVHREDLQKADRYIRDHLSEDLSLERLAKVANLDATYFHKLYTRVYGKTPAQRVLSRRITAAQIALEEGNLSIAEIAAQCGFASQTYFAAKFRQITGKTPTAYRKFKQESR